MGWRDFDKEFKQYRVRADLNQMQPVEILIADQYKQDGEVLINKRFWFKLERTFRDNLGFSPENDMLLRRLVINVNGTLYSAERILDKEERNTPKDSLLKPPPKEFKDLSKFVENKEIKWRNIKVDNIIIAKIGIISQKALMAQADQNFANQQAKSFLISLIAAVFISIIIGFIGSRVFSRPIDKLSKATKTLTQGDYNIDPPVAGNDEIAQLGRDLYILSQTLSSNLHSKNQWIADISHELRTPVAVIKAQIEAMLDGIRKPTDENLMVFSNQIDDLSKLINDLHELSMSDLGAMNYQFDEINLSKVLTQVLHELPINEFDVQNEVTESLFIFADQRRIEQLFRNLMQNTIKYTDAPGKILIEAKQEKDLIIINWHDSGPGVTDEQLERLFERLYRAENSRNKKSGGSGLGLSICQNIVSAHQGKIFATHSHLGGINITIEFPKEANNV